MVFICCRDMKPFWTGPAWRVRAIIYLLALSSLPSDGQFITSSSFIPPSGVRSSVNNHLHNRRFNIRAGESFTIACNVQHNSLPFIAELYLDGRSTVITDGLLPNTTYSKTGTNGVSSQINLELTFDNFQAVHNGLYDCFANTTDGSTTTFVDSRLYGTGPITVALLSSQYLILYSDEDISIPTQIRGEFYDIDWIYHPTDPLLGSIGREILDITGAVMGAGNVRFSQELVLTQGTTSHKAGYYAPEVQETVVTRRTIMAGESVLVRAYASPTASLPAVENQSPGADLTVTCTATGYPEPTISISTSDISASSSMGEHVTTTTATPSTVYTITRSITFSGLLASDCGMVTCTASNADRDGTQTATGTTPIQVIGSPDVSITPSPDQAISIGGSLTLSCEAEDCTTNSFVYMWYRDGVNVENGTSLSISGASSSDFGRYECNVTGDGGTGSAVIYISEQNSLTLTSELSAPPNPSLSTVEGSSVDHYNIESQATFSITCTFESPNNFDLEASKDGVVLSTDPASTSTLSSPTRTSKTLTIQLSSFSTSDNGVYQCNASNSDRNLLSRRVLLTTGALSAMRVSEEFIELVPPNSLQLEVSVDGAFSSLQWYRGSQQLMEGSGGVSFSDFSRSLTISNTSSSDAGQYQLIASANDRANLFVLFNIFMVNNEAATVQIHINPGSKCTDFIDTAERLERLTRIETVVKNATTNCFRCQVFFVPSSAFRCIGSNELVVVFVAEIAFSYSTLSPASPLDLLRSWARESPVLNVGGLLLQVDGSCSVEIASVSATPECDPVSTPSTPMSSPTSTDNVTAQSDQLTLIIPVVVSCVVVAVLVGAGAVLLVAVCVVRRKKKETVSLAKPEDKYAYTDPDSGVEIQQNPAYEMTGPVPENHIYDFIPAEKRLAVNEEYM